MGEWLPPEVNNSHHEGLSWITEPRLVYQTLPYLPSEPSFFLAFSLLTAVLELHFSNPLSPDMKTFIFTNEYPVLKRAVDELFSAGYRSMASLLNDSFHELVQPENFLVFEDESIFVQTRPHRMSIKTASLLAHALIPFAKDDRRLQYLIEGILSKLFFFIPYSPYSSEFQLKPPVPLTLARITKGENFFGLPPKFSLDILFPFWVAHDYFEATDVDVVFNKRFHCASWILIDLLRNEMNSTQPFFRSSAFLSRPSQPQNLIWSAYRPSGRVQSLPFNVPNNIFAHHVLTLVEEIATTIYDDTELADAAAELTALLQKGIEDHAITTSPLGDIIGRAFIHC